MKLSKVFKKDVVKYLGIIPDKRRKDLKQFIAENGGYINAIESLKSRLSEKTEFKVKKEIRQKQVKTQKEYVERKQDIRPKTDVKKKGRKSKKSIEAASKIQKFFRTEKERNKLFTLQPKDTWKTKFSYTLKNKLPSGKIQMDVLLDEPIGLEDEEFVDVFQFYKVNEFLIKKIKEVGKGYKVNIGFEIEVVTKQLKEYKKNEPRDKQYEYIYKDMGKIVKSVMIFDKTDVYNYFEEVYGEYKQLLGGYDVQYTVAIKNIHIDIYKTKALNGKSYIPLPEWVANKKAVINVKNDDNNCFIYSVLCGYLDICDKPHPERVNHYTNHLKLLKYEEKDMPMKIDKIMHFEKRNNLRINVFGVEETSIYPLYVSSNRSNENSNKPIIY